MRFDIGPHPIAANETLELSLVTGAADLAHVTVDFNGTVMKMIPNRVVLTAREPGRFEGQAALSICLSGDMEWMARVEFERDGTRYARAFIFQSVTPK